MAEEYFYISRDISKMKKSELVRLIKNIAEDYVDADKNNHAIGDVFPYEHLVAEGILSYSSGEENEDN